MCRSTNRTGIAEPEVYFRIVHVTLQDQAGSAYRQQAVDVALGPEGAFKSGSFRTLRRRALAEPPAGAGPQARRGRRPPRQGKPARVVELLRKAMGWRELLDGGELATQADIARREGLTRARVTQVLALLRLAPAIQQYILAMPETVDHPVVTERALRPIAQLEEHQQQMEAFEHLVGSVH